ncbi:MAG: hypothetical protein M3Q97_08355, partial [Bacteroidota bacterium]|nr:hypothetical protein [Bacteroidota bacterium]
MSARPILLFSLLALFHLHSFAQDLVTYAGNEGDERFYSVIQLSDSTYLATGTADDLAWVPSGITITQISAPGINNASNTTDKIGFLLHLSSDLKNALRVIHFPAGAVQDIRHIKTSNMPGATTSDIFISGTTMDSRANGGGYFIARLNNNFVSGVPTGISWVYNVYAAGRIQSEQPWDVGSDGKVVFAAGQSYGKDSLVVLRLKADGSGLDIVSGWRTHWGTNVATGKNASAQFSPSNAHPYIAVSFSMIDFKASRRCDLRSWSSGEYGVVTGDGNGSSRTGTWPLDIFYSSSCDTAQPLRT